MLLTIVHNDTDCVNFWIKELRYNLRHVKPTVTFKPCWVWDFTERILEENSHILVILSKHNRRFAKIFLDALKKHKAPVRVSKVCVVLEGQDNELVNEYEDLFGKDNVAALENMHNALRWLPKVCAFLYNKGKSKKTAGLKQLNCAIPKIYDDKKSNELRESLTQGLRDLGINVLDESQNDVEILVCCVLHRKVCEDVNSTFKALKDRILNEGGKIIEYTLTDYEDNKRESDNVIYGKSNIVLFVLHVLFVLNLVNFVSVQGKRLRRAQRQKHKRKTKNLSSFKFKHDNHDCPTFGPRLLIPVGCSVIYNPSLVLFFLTPFPYIALMLCMTNGEARYWNITMTTWMVACTAVLIVLIFLVLGIVFAWALGLGLIPLYIAMCISAGVQIRYLLITN